MRHVFKLFGSFLKAIINFIVYYLFKMVDYRLGMDSNHIFDISGKDELLVKYGTLDPLFIAEIPSKIQESTKPFSKDNILFKKWAILLNTLFYKHFFNCFLFFLLFLLFWKTFHRKTCHRKICSRANERDDQHTEFFQKSRKNIKKRTKI